MIDPELTHPFNQTLLLCLVDAVYYLPCLLVLMQGTSSHPPTLPTHLLTHPPTCRSKPPPRPLPPPRRASFKPHCWQSQSIQQRLDLHLAPLPRGKSPTHPLTYFPTPHKECFVPSHPPTHPHRL